MFWHFRFEVSRTMALVARYGDSNVLVEGLRNQGFRVRSRCLACGLRISICAAGEMRQGRGRGTRLSLLFWA